MPVRLAAAKDAAQRAGLPAADVMALLNGVRQAAGPTMDTFLVTITNGGMVDFARNMLSSLGLVDALLPKLVVGMGVDVCKDFRQFTRTTCVEVFQDSNSTIQSKWGTREYWRIVFRKHVLLTVIASSDLADSVIYSDPDIVFLGSPAGLFSNLSREADNDLTFSSNNMLEPNATSLQDLSSRYETHGLANTSLGPKNRRVDINSGLFHMFTSPLVADFFMAAVRVLKEEEFNHGHYQQFSLGKALVDTPGIHVGVADAELFVNGNVFWGHRELLRPQSVVSIHANWMQPEIKKRCLDAAGLWVATSAIEDDVSSQARLPAALLSWKDSTDYAVLDDRHATILACHSARTQRDEQAPRNA